MASLRRDFLPPDLEPELRAAGFDACVAVQARPTLDETRWLLELADRYAFVAGVVGWADLQAPDLRAQLEPFLGRPKLVVCATSCRRSPTTASCCARSSCAAWPPCATSGWPTTSSSTRATCPRP